MNKKRRHIQPDRKSLLEDKIVYSGSHIRDTEVSLIRYNTDFYESLADVDVKNPKKYFHDNCRNWLIVSGLSDTKRVTDLFSVFELHKVDVKGILEVDDHSAISDYSDKIVFRANGLHFEEDGQLHENQESFILGKDYLVSLVEDGAGSFDEVISAIENSKVNIRTKGSDYLFVILLDKIISRYRDVIDRVERNLETYTELVIASNETETLLADMISDRKAYLKLKHIVYSLKDSVTKLMRNPNGIITKDTMVYVEDILQQLQFINQDIEGCDQAFNSIINIHSNNDNQKMNEIMKRLTVISTVFLPMTFFAGLWGMNFQNMPETQLEHGYYIALSVIVITAILSWYYLKRKKWL